MNFRFLESQGNDQVFGVRFLLSILHMVNRLRVRCSLTLEKIAPEVMAIMASRLMHLIIGHHIAEKLQIEDRTSFLLGSIAPDAVQTKDESHFFKGEHRDFSRYIDYHGFLDKYRSYSDNFYVLGYFVLSLPMTCG